MDAQPDVTFATVLARRLRQDPGRPLVTFYDDATGERVELSATTYANWVAKTASLLVDELGLERGDRVVLDLPPHWLGTVVLGAAWESGLVVVPAAVAGDPATADAEAVVCGPDTLAAWAPRAGDLVVLASALLPLGVRFRDPVPGGVHDLGVEVWSQPDAFVPWDAPSPTDDALVLADGALTQAQLWREAAAGRLVGSGRLLSTADPAQEPAILGEPLACGGSLVLVARAEPDALAAIAAAEHVTARFPA